MPARGRNTAFALGAILAVIAAVWATAALFGPRPGDEKTPEGFIRSFARDICAGDVGDATKTLGGNFAFAARGTLLDRALASQLLENERRAGRFFPLVADVKVVPDKDDVYDVAIIGVIAKADPDRFPEAPTELFRVDARIHYRDGSGTVLSAKLR